MRVQPVERFADIAISVEARRSAPDSAASLAKRTGSSGFVSV